MNQLKTICAWCKTIIKDGKMVDMLGKEYCSHGICKQCSKNLHDELDENDNNSKSKTRT